MNTSQAEQVLNSYLQSNNAQIRDINTHQVVVRAMHYFAALAVSEAKDEDITMIKNFKYNDVKEYIEPYLGSNEKSIDFINGAKWMRDIILKLL